LAGFLLFRAPIIGSADFGRGLTALLVPHLGISPPISLERVVIAIVHGNRIGSDRGVGARRDSTIRV